MNKVRIFLKLFPFLNSECLKTTILENKLEFFKLSFCITIYEVTTRHYKYIIIWIFTGQLLCVSTNVVMEWWTSHVLTLKVLRHLLPSPKLCVLASMNCFQFPMSLGIQEERKRKLNFQVIKILIDLFVVIISQCINISYHHYVHFKYIQFLKL